MNRDPLRQFFCDLYGVRRLTPEALSPLRTVENSRSGGLLGYAATVIGAFYSWNVPNEEALREIARHGPIVEVGPATGYWAHRLAERGANITAYEKNDITLSTSDMLECVSAYMLECVDPVQQHITSVLSIVLNYAVERGVAFRWHPVTIAPGEDAIDKHPQDSLFLGWPDNPTPALEMEGLYAQRTLARYQGNRVLYIGTWDSQQTASDGFHDALERDWVCEKVVPIETGLSIKLDMPVNLYSLRRRKIA